MFGEIRNEQGELLDYAYQAGDIGRRELVVIGHGVTANKDRTVLRALAETLGVAGFPSLRLSFSGNGDSEGEFTDSTITKAVADLGAVLDAVDGHRVAYVGHSMGSAVGVLRAATDDRISLLVSLAGMVRTREFATRHFGNLVPGGSFMWDKLECPLSDNFMRDMHEVGTVVDKAIDVTVPWLFVHGTDDTVVPMIDTDMMYEEANEPKQRIDVEGADHLFNGEVAVSMIKQVCSWLADRLA